MINRASTALFALSIFAAAANAAQRPTPGSADPRVQFVDYNPNEVVELHAYYGYSIHLIFGDGERIGTKQVVLGDSEAWQETHDGNNLFVKPGADDATTNMTVITNRHSYEFYLTASDLPARSAGLPPPSFAVAFRYPEDDAHLQALADSQEQERINIATALAQAKNSHPRNLNYYAEGNPDVIPNQAWDDGMFTYFKYVGGREMPAVFVVNADGSESLTNSHVDDDTIVVHQLAEHFVVRKGGVVACVYDKSYDPARGGSYSGTVSPDVERRVQGANP